MDLAAIHGGGAGLVPIKGGISNCRRWALGRSSRSCLAAAGRKAQFADQSHVAFYERPRKQRRSGTSSPRGGAAFASAGKFELSTVDDESVQEVIRQLEELQLKAKAKKQELKSIKEMEKKKAKKAKKEMEKMSVASAMRKRKKESSCSSSESSSDSESSSCASRFDMAMIRQELVAATAAAAAATSPRSIIEAPLETLSLSELSLGDKSLAARVEVCTGGKCRKAGSQQVLAAFQGEVSSSAAPCKCMGMCGKGPNVRIQRAGDGAPVVYNHVGVQDVEQLLQIGRPPCRFLTNIC